MPVNLQLPYTNPVHWRLLRWNGNMIINFNILFRQERNFRIVWLNIFFGIFNYGPTTVYPLCNEIAIGYAIAHNPLFTDRRILIMALQYLLPMVVYCELRIGVFNYINFRYMIRS